MKILIEESVLRQALEALEASIDVPSYGGHPRQEAAYAALRTALDAAEKVEPVAWIITTDNTNLHQLDPNRENNWLAFDVNQFKNDSARALVISNTQPLYLHPALEAAENVEPVGEMVGHHNYASGKMPTIRWRDGFWPNMFDKFYTHPAPAVPEPGADKTGEK